MWRHYNVILENYAVVCLSRDYLVTSDNFPSHTASKIKGKYRKIAMNINSPSVARGSRYFSTQES